MHRIKENFKRVEQFIGIHGFYIISIIFVASGTFSYFQGMAPFGADNLISLSIAARPSLISFFLNPMVDYLPVYRPVSMATLWIQYQIFGVKPEAYFIFNILIWIGCSLVLYLYVYYITKSRFISFSAAILMLLDFRASEALYWIIERQTPLAILFGSIALLVFIESNNTNALGKSKIILITVFLLFSALSKEYGLAFTGALIFSAICSLPVKKWRTPVLIGMMVVTLYFVLRFGVAESDTTFEYCNDRIGYRTKTLSLCYADYDQSVKTKFFLWNSGASFLGTFFPQLFSVNGEWIGLHSNSGVKVYFEFIVSLIFVLMVLASLYKYPKLTLSVFFIIVANAILNFLLYRPRNQLVGLFGYYSLVGVGSYSAWKMLAKYRVRQILTTVFVSFIIAIVSIRAAGLSHYLDTVARFYSELDPCEDVNAFPTTQAFDGQVITELYHYYWNSTPRCIDPSNQ